MNQRMRTVITILAVFVAAGALAAPAAAVPFALSEASFLGASLIDFGPTQTFAPINGVTIGGVLFGFTVGGVGSADARIDGGPGVTAHISPANIEGTTAGVLSLTFAAPQYRFGYGFATLGTGSTTVELFSGAISLGTLTKVGAPDPIFRGGFLGVGSDLAFTSVRVTFLTSPATTRFAFDNAVFSTSPVPEPATLTLVGAGAAAAFGRRLLRGRKARRQASS